MSSTNTCKVFLCAVMAILVAMASAMPSPGHGGGYGGGNSHIYRKDHGYNNFDFGYGINDHYTGDNHGRHESGRGYDNVYGGYYIRDPYSYPRKVSYVADHYGTHQTIHGSQNGLYVNSKDVNIIPH